jgi:hypothetical protein
MSEDSPKPPLVSRTGTAVDLFLTVLFFFFMRDVLAPHVPSQDPLAINIVSSMVSFCMSGVFWLAAGMLRVTWVDYLRNQQAKEK